MRNAIRTSLKKDDVLQILWMKSINGCALEFSERNPHLHPTFGRNISGKFRQRERVRKACGKFRDLQAFARSGEHNARQVRSRNGLLSETPKIEIVPEHFGKAVAKINSPYFRLPAAAAVRLPLHAK